MFDEEKAAKFLEDNNGEVSPEKMTSFLLGHEEPTDDKGKVESSTTEDPEVKDQVVAQDDPAANGTAKEGETVQIIEEDKEPVVLANDGKNTIPYSVLSKTRDDLRDAKAALDESNKKLADLEAKFKDAPNLQGKVDEAILQDQGTGTTEAMDELIADLEEDYPAAAKLVKQLAGQVQTLSAAKQADEQARIDEELATTAANEFTMKADELLEGFSVTSSTPEFAAWFAKAPSYIQATRATSDPAVAVDVVKQYLAETANATGPGEKGKDKQQESPKVDQKKVDDAIKNAESKQPVNSLSDIPGGGNPEHDELNAIPNMDPMQMFNKFQNAGRDKMEQMLSRLL